MLATLLTVGAVVAALLTIGGLALAFWRIMKRLDVIGEGVLGKPEVRDFSGAVIEEAVPSIQARVSSLEDEVRSAVHGNTSRDDRVAALEAWRDEHTRDGDAVLNRVMDYFLGGQTESH